MLSRQKVLCAPQRFDARVSYTKNNEAPSRNSLMYMIRSNFESESHLAMQGTFTPPPPPSLRLLLQATFCRCPSSTTRSSSL